MLTLRILSPPQDLQSHPDKMFQEQGIGFTDGITDASVTHLYSHSIQKFRAQSEETFLERDTRFTDGITDASVTHL